ncbi:MAG: hypothetical protein RL757_2596 [Bacteroidota bacterium]|jgi:choice-of-anchor A domain-containing protein
MNIFDKKVVFVFSLLFCLVRTTHGQCNLGTANQFNLVVFDAVTINPGADVQGKALFGSNVTLTTYGFGTTYTSGQGDVLLVNGNLSFSNGTVNWGNAKATGSISGTFSTPNGTKTAYTTLPVSFATVKSELETRSTYWGTLGNQNGTVTVQPWGAIDLNCQNSSGQVRFNITAANINACNGLNILNGNNAASILINVSGTSMTFTNFGINTYPSPTKIVWNLYQATSVTVNGFGIKGSMIAPFAAMSFSNSHIDGTLAVKGLSGNGESHNFIFGNTNLLCPPTCSNVTTAGTIGSPQNACSSPFDPATLTETGAPTGGSGSFEYQWQRSSDNATWTDIAGATAQSYDPPSMLSRGYFRRGVRRSLCAPYLYSGSVLIDFATANPTVLLAGPYNICSGGTAVLQPIYAGGIGSKLYQWQTPNIPGGWWENIAGATSANYTTPALTATKTYRVLMTFSGTNNCGTIYGSPVDVTVKPAAAVTVSANTNVFCGPGSAILTATTTGGVGCGFQWQSSPDNATWTAIATATSSTYVTPVLTASTYFRLVYNCASSGCGTVTSGSTFIQIRPLPARACPITY